MVIFNLVPSDLSIFPFRASSLSSNVCISSTPDNAAVARWQEAECEPVRRDGMAYEIGADGLAGLSARPLMAPAKHPGNLNDVDALLAPRRSGYGGAPAVLSGVFVRQLMTHSGHLAP